MHSTETLLGSFDFGLKKKKKKKSEQGSGGACL
jgi:hypothetical protein